LQAPVGQPPDVSARLLQAWDMATAADGWGGSCYAEVPAGYLRAGTAVQPCRLTSLCLSYASCAWANAALFNVSDVTTHPHWKTWWYPSNSPHWSQRLL